MLRVQDDEKPRYISNGQEFRKFALTERSRDKFKLVLTWDKSNFDLGVQPELILNTLDTIIRGYRSYCRRIAYEVLRDYDSANDAVQVAFISVLCFLISSTPEEIHALQKNLCHLYSWLYTIVHNAALNEAKFRKRTFLVDDRENWLYQEEADEYSNPEMIVMQSGEKDILRDLLDWLPESYRKVIVLHVLQKKTYEEIAKEEQCTVENARTRFHRATRSLAKIVKRKGISENELRRGLLMYKFRDNEDSYPREDKENSLVESIDATIDRLLQKDYEYSQNERQR